MINSFYLHFCPTICSFFPGAPFRRLRIFLWRLGGVRISHTANIYPRAEFFPPSKCTISIGDNTFCGNGVLVCGGNVTIGKNCDLAPRCLIHAGSHEIGTSEHRAGKTYAGKIEVGDGTWIGTGATILSGAKIGEGCMIAAGSVVIAGEYPDNVLLAGVPAKVKKLLSAKNSIPPEK